MATFGYGWDYPERELRTDFIATQLDNIDKNFEAGLITEQQRDEAIDEVLKSQEH